MMTGLPRFAPPDSTADNVQAIAWIIGASGGFLLALALFVVAVFRPWRHMTAHLSTKLGGIDLAVNNVPDGTPTLVEQVTWLFSAVGAIAEQAGYDLPPKPQARPRTAKTRATDLTPKRQGQPRARARKDDHQ